MLLACLRVIKHFGVPVKIENACICTSSVKDTAVYKELFMIDSIQSPERDFDYLEDLASYFNTELNEEVLKFNGEWLSIKPEYRGKYTFIFTSVDRNDHYGFLAEIKTISRGMTVIDR